MATLGTARAPRPTEPAPGSLWRLRHPLDAYSRSTGAGLATQVAAGRHLRVLEAAPASAAPASADLAAANAGSATAEGSTRRLRVRLWEDGYPCWLATADLLQHGEPAPVPPAPRAWDRAGIEARLPAVLAFAQHAMATANHYLWGGTLGPNFDCSGLVQTAFARVGIWLPRDAYLQERFCQPVAVEPGHTSLLQPGDLLFFGTARRCTHVGLHLGGGRYLHSSGLEHGRNGLGMDDLNPRNSDPVASHYRLTLRGAGRITHSHDGSPLPP